MLKSSSQSGFSLIELLIAVVILAVGLLGLAELQITAMKVNSQSTSIQTANSLAQQVIEEIVAMDPADPMFGSDAGSAPWTGSLGNQVTVVGGGTYNITYSVDADYRNVTNLCFITVNVSSDVAQHNVTGNKIRTVAATTLKRAI